MEFSEIFTWMTVWVLIIFAVYSSESSYGRKLRQHAAPLLLIFSIPVTFLFFLAFYDAFYISPAAAKKAAARQADQASAGRATGRDVAGAARRRKEPAAAAGQPPLWDENA